MASARAPNHRSLRWHERCTLRRMHSRAKLLGLLLAAFGAVALFGIAAWVQAPAWGVALAACGTAIMLAAGILGWRMARAPRPVVVAAGARPRVPFWIAVDAPFERSRRE